jgi:hypothetical protein
LNSLHIGRIAKFALVCGLAVTALTSSATTLTLSGIGTGPLTGSYQESGFTIAFGTDAYGTTSGGSAVLVNNPDSTSQPYALITLTLTDGGTFSFSSIDVANLNGSFPSANNYGARDSLIAISATLGGVVQYYSFPPAPNGVLTTEASGSSLTVDELQIALGTNNFPDDVEGFTNLVVTPTASPVPEPSSLMLMGSGMLGLAGFGRRLIARK